MAVDPVCKMTIREDMATEKVEYEGKTYWFCAAGCRQRFVDDPDMYSGDEQKDWVRGE
jgi:YHS domain-containing protein